MDISISDDIGHTDAQDNDSATKFGSSASPQHATNSSKSRIYKRTESGEASLRVLGELNRKRAEAREKRIKDAEFKRKMEEVPVKSIEECLQTLTPLSPKSRLMTPTRASRNATAKKKKEDLLAQSEKPHRHAFGSSTPAHPSSPPTTGHEVAPLAASSHLLSPTTASKQCVYHPPPPPKPISRAGTPTKQVHVSDRLTALNTARKAGRYDKKPVEVDPREKGWDGSLTASYVEPDSPPKSPRRSSVGDRYSDVRSRLHKPTAASRCGQWNSASSSSPCVSSPDVVISPKRSYSPTRGPLSQVKSRLHNPTAASRAGQYHADKTEQRSSTPVRSSTPTSHHRRPTSSPSSSVSSKCTAAQRSAQRSKYVPPNDPADVGKQPPRASSAPAGRRRGKTARDQTSEADTSSEAIHYGPRPLFQIRREIKAIVDDMKSGKSYDTGKLGALMAELHDHPKYLPQKTARCSAWREKYMPHAQSCLSTMRGFIPPYFMGNATHSQLMKDGLSPNLARRILHTKSLWVLRMHKEARLGMHGSDLTRLTERATEELDLVELSALFAAIPRSIGEACDDVTEKWHADLETELKLMISQQRNNVLASHRARRPEYKNQVPVYPVDEDTDGGCDNNDYLDSKGEGEGDVEEESFLEDDLIHNHTQLPVPPPLDTAKDKYDSAGTEDVLEESVGTDEVDHADSLGAVDSLTIPDDTGVMTPGTLGAANVTASLKEVVSDFDDDDDDIGKTASAFNDDAAMTSDTEIDCVGASERHIVASPATQEVNEEAVCISSTSENGGDDSGRGVSHEVSSPEKKKVPPHIPLLIFPTVDDSEAGDAS